MVVYVCVCITLVNLIYFLLLTERVEHAWSCNRIATYLYMLKRKFNNQNDPWSRRWEEDVIYIIWFKFFKCDFIAMFTNLILVHLILSNEIYMPKRVYIYFFQSNHSHFFILYLYCALFIVYRIYMFYMNCKININYDVSYYIVFYIWKKNTKQHLNKKYWN